MFPRLLISALITLLIGATSHGQTLHSVHAGASGVRYGVEGPSASSVYEWFVIDGGVIAGNFNDEIEIDWGIVPGIYEIRVVETNIYGCLGDTVNAFVEVTDRFDYNPFPDVIEICDGDIYILDAGSGFVSYLWNDDSDHISQTFAASEAGRYWVQVVDENGLIGSDTVEIVVHPTPVVDLGPDVVLQSPEDEIVLDAENPGSMYLWSTGSIGRTLTVRGAFAPVTVWVEVTTMQGCSARDTVFIDLEDGDRLVIPTIFTPNDDGINDTWLITDRVGNELSIHYPRAIIEVFNRWGETVYKSQPGYPTPWDGTSRGRPLQMDSYHFIITLNEPGVTDITGNITIVR